MCRGMKKALPHWGLRCILSLKLSKYTVNTVSRLPGHDWKDHTERLMGKRAHLNTRGCQSEQQGGRGDGFTQHLVCFLEKVSEMMAMATSGWES